MDIDRKIIKWLLSGDTGLSSEAMVAAVVDCGVKQMDNHPLDPADLNRCMLLLMEIPEIYYSMDKIAPISTVWFNLVINWNKLTKCFIDEAGLNFSRGNCAPKTYDMMIRIGC